MFGRSGQMFPRQRAFHDAIYEEEYGSDQGEECCQGRGMSAIFCWLLSVIILIGLAASVVLTVFFLLKSKNYMSKNGELDLVIEGDPGNNFQLPETTTELNSLDFSLTPLRSSKESSSGPGRGRTGSSEDKKTGGERSSTSTRFPPMRRGPHQIFKESEEENEPLTFQTLYPNGKSTSQERNAILGKLPSTSSTPSPPTPEVKDNDGGHTHETGEESSSSEEDPQYLTTTTSRPLTQHIFFTAPPPPLTTTTTNGFGFRRKQTTKVPTERTSFTTSTEALDLESDSNSEQEDRKNHSRENYDKKKNYSDDGISSSSTVLREFVTTPSTSTTDRDDVTYKAEESQLNKMLLEEIPPHREKGDKKKSQEEDTSKSAEFNLTLNPTSPDPLARIIKNLGPRWGRNRTVETTTMTSGSHKYDFTISSREKTSTRWRDSKEKEKSSKEKSSKEKSSPEKSSSTEKDNTSSSKELQSAETRSTSTSSSISSGTNFNKSSSERKNSSGGYGLLNTIQGPDLSRKKSDEEGQQSPPAPEFLDILVGSEDHKSLITKETDDGIVTSAILPPWYDTTGGNHTSSNGTRPEDQDHESSESEESSVSSEHTQPQNNNRDTHGSASSSVLGGLFDFFNTLPNMNRNRNREEEIRKPLPPPPPSQNPKRIVLKRPGGELQTPPGYNAPLTSTSTSASPPVSRGQAEIPKKVDEKSTEQEEDNGVESAKIHTILPSNIMTTTIIPEAVVTQEDIRPANNAFHYGSPDGGTNIYGYYPDDDDKDNDKTVEHHMIQSESISDPNELMGLGKGLGSPEKSPAHSIELQINSDASSEVVIEQDGGDHSQGQGHDDEENGEDYNHYATRYGETHHASGSEIRKHVVEPPQSQYSPMPMSISTPTPMTTRLGGGGIRRPINRGGVGAGTSSPTMTSTVGESNNDFLEMKASENKPMLANSNIPSRSIPHQLIRQRRPPPTTATTPTTAVNGNNKRVGLRTTTTTAYPTVAVYVPNSSISGEVLDNSAEQDPLPQETEDFKRKNYNLDEKSGENGKLDGNQGLQRHPQYSPGSFEMEGGGGGGESTFDGSGSGEQPGKWSRPDPNNSEGLPPGSVEEQEHDHSSANMHDNHQNHHESHEEMVKVNPVSGDENDVVERKPIETLDETLYPDHTGSGGSGSIEIENKKVFQVFPVGYSSSTSSTTERPRSEATIPEPEQSSFSGEGHDQGQSQGQSPGFVPPAPVNFHENMHTFSPPSSDSIYQSKDGWRPLIYSDQEEDTGPTGSGPLLPQPQSQRPQIQPPPPPPRPALHWRDRLLHQGILRQPVVTPASMTFDLSTAASQNALNSQHLSTEVEDNGHEEEEHEQEHEALHENENINHSHTNSEPEGGHVLWDENKNNKQEQSEELHSSKVHFPQGESHDGDSVDQNQVHQLVPPPHFHNNQPQIQRIPMQIPPQQLQHQQHHQQQNHPHQNFQHQHHQRPQTQFQYQNNIDRSKYMMRPAPPPIVMRRTPINNMGYRHPHNNALPPRPQLIPQVAQPVQHQQFNPPPPPEFHRSQQNLVNRRRFKTLGARPRGNINWTEGGAGNKQGEAERRNG